MNEELLAEICRREIDNGCYSHSIQGITVYNYLKRRFRQLSSKDTGLESKTGTDFKSIFLIVKTTIESFIHLARILFSKSKSDNLIHAFSRMDSVNGVYVDKFTDPIIDYSSVKNSYLIFQRGWKHPKPRVHSEKVVYSDGIYVLARVWSLLFWPFFQVNNKRVFTGLYKSLTSTFPNTCINKRAIAQTVLYSLCATNLFAFFLKRLSVKNVLAPSRADFLFVIPAAKKNNTQVLELQHGITYDETVTYSGFRDPMFTPDRFLSFGNMLKNNVYGIDEKSIFNIGWAFAEYVKSIEYCPLANSVLVVSEPSHNEQLFDAMCTFAKENPNISFYFRPHPLEHISAIQRSTIEDTPNIYIDDNTCNIWVTLMRFSHVIGVDSTVLYEALSLNKNVGKVFMCGLHPKYLQEEDQSFFDKIDCSEAFTFFSRKQAPEFVKSIYSRYNKEAFEVLLK